VAQEQQRLGKGHLDGEAVLVYEMPLANLKHRHDRRADKAAPVRGPVGGVTGTLHDEERDRGAVIEALGLGLQPPEVNLREAGLLCGLACFDLDDDAWAQQNVALIGGPGEGQAAGGWKPRLSASTTAPPWHS